MGDPNAYAACSLLIFFLSAVVLVAKKIFKSCRASQIAILKDPELRRRYFGVGFVASEESRSPLLPSSGSSPRRG